MPPLTTLTAYFNLPLNRGQVHLFRGAVIECLGRENDLFHNHDNTIEAGESQKYIERYPLVQYRIHNRKAAIFSINEGAEALTQALAQNRLAGLHINKIPAAQNHFKRNQPLVSHTTLENHTLQWLPQGQWHTYRIYNYLPFKTDTYREYKGLFDVQEKNRLLCRLLQQHIGTCTMRLTGKKTAPADTAVLINQVDRVKDEETPFGKLLAFDLSFSANLLLPNRLGLGRKPAFGYGWIVNEKNLSARKAGG